MSGPGGGLTTKEPRDVKALAAAAAAVGDGNIMFSGNPRNENRLLWDAVVEVGGLSIA